MPQSKLDEIKSLLDSAGDDVREAVLVELRRTIPIHLLEKEWNTTAEFVLEAISRSQDITKRGVRGIIAELAFSEYVLKPMRPIWREHKLTGDLPYDALIEDAKGKITIQTKNQRLEKGVPLRTNATMVRRYPDVVDWYVAETQKTRSGKSKKKNKSDIDDALLTVEDEQQSTRPYRFGEFDILSVCLQPSSGDWNRFMYTPARTLIASLKNAALISTFQPVPSLPRFAWTDNLITCIEWVRNPDTCPATQAYIAPPPKAAKLKKKVIKKKKKKKLIRGR